MYEYQLLLSLATTKSNGAPAEPVPMPLSAYWSTFAQSTFAASAALRGVYVRRSAAIVFARRFIVGASSVLPCMGRIVVASEYFHVLPAVAAMSASNFACAAFATSAYAANWGAP